MSRKRILYPSRKKIIGVFFGGLIFFVVGILWARSFIFRQCVEHVDHSPTHSHTQLKIIQEGREIEIPPSIGLTQDCMHPLHTHDATGLIHMEYPYPVPFFLGDFFDVMGTTFNNSQIGAIRTFDGYKIILKKNGKQVTSPYRWILLKDLDKIEIQVLKE